MELCSIKQTRFALRKKWSFVPFPLGTMNLFEVRCRSLIVVSTIFVITGVIDSKGKDPRDVTDNNYQLGSSQPWNHGQDGTIRSRERQPSATAPRITTADVALEPVRNVPLRPSYPASRPQGVVRSQSLQAAPQPPSQPRILPANKPLVNTRTRSQPVNPLAANPPRVQPVTTPKPTTTSTTQTAPKLSNDYEYIDYDAVPPGSNTRQNGPSISPDGNDGSTGSESPSEAANSRTKRSPKRRKGKLLGLPTDFLSQPTNTTLNVSSDFSCSDKVSTLAYADIASNCTKFHLCLEIKKGKMRDNVLYCQAGHGYSQEAAACLPLGSFNCVNSHKFFVLDKSKTGQGKTWKLPIAWTKKSLFYKSF